MKSSSTRHLTRNSSTATAVTETSVLLSVKREEPKAETVAYVGLPSAPSTTASAAWTKFELFIRLDLNYVSFARDKIRHVLLIIFRLCVIRFDSSLQFYLFLGPM